MPVFKAGSKSLPSLDGYICGQQWFCSRLAVSVLIVIIVLAGFLLSRQSLRQNLPKKVLRLCSTGQDITWAPGAPFPSIITNYLTVSGRWVRLKQGQGRFEKRANRAVSRGEASGTATVGLGGSREEGKMEEKERPSAGSRSRGVSTNWRDEAGLSGSLASPDQLLATIEHSDHVRTYPGGGAAGFHEDQDSMEGARFGRLAGASAESGPRATPGARGHVSKSLFGEHVTDDEHILYGVKDSSPSGLAIGTWLPSHQFELNFARSPPRPETPSASAPGFSPALIAPKDRLKSIAIPSRVGAGNRTSWVTNDEAMDGKGRAMCRPEDGSSPSSYPPASPLLPPPPPTAHEDFDYTAVMFPGPARDGGIRMVTAHKHSGNSSTGIRGEVASGPADPGSSRARHTRVYGGGVCLACAAAAAGEGGFYGDSVRPEDKW